MEEKEPLVVISDLECDYATKSAIWEDGRDGVDAYLVITKRLDFGNGAGRWVALLFLMNHRGVGVVDGLIRRDPPDLNGGWARGIVRPAEGEGIPPHSITFERVYRSKEGTWR